jgi:YcxB-like protein
MRPMISSITAPPYPSITPEKNSFAGEVTFQQYCDFYASVHRFQTITMLGVLGILLIAILFFGNALDNPSKVLWTTLLYTCTTLAIIYPFSLRNYTLKQQKKWNEYCKTHQNMKATFGNEGITIHTSIAITHIPWYYFIKCDRTIHMVALYLTPNQVFLIHKDFFSTIIDWESFNKMIEAHLSLNTINNKQ